ncbi:IS256 family transposase [Streptomyces sp. NPDC092296]|uniref:IS256 family transposase n=1 Tax=Streptomyces sp. NPDC092296 TaxID=3366012 RepID=UPI003814C8AA
MSTTTDHLIEAVGGVPPARVGEGVEGADAKSMPLSPDGLSRELLEELSALAAEKVACGGPRLTGEGGTLPEPAPHLMQAALEAEMDRHPATGAGPVDGHGSHSGGNMRNGYRSKKATTQAGPVTVQAPRDRPGTFSPRPPHRYARRTGAPDELVLSLTAKGLTSGAIVAHPAEVYRMTTTKKTVPTTTDKALEPMAERRTHPPDPVCPVIFIDAAHVRTRDGHEANRPIHVAVAVTADGHREILGLRAGAGGEGAKHRRTVPTEIRNRGVKDILILGCDGLTALPGAVNAIRPQTVVQTRIVHLIRNSLRHTSRRDWAEVARDPKPVHTPVNEDQARQHPTELGEKRNPRHPSTTGTRERAWNEFTPFPGLPDAIRQAVHTTNATESPNTRYRRPAQARRPFPNETPALKRLHPATHALDPTGRGRQRWNNRWKSAPNDFDLLFDGRLTAGRVQADQPTEEPTGQPDESHLIPDRPRLTRDTQKKIHTKHQAAPDYQPHLSHPDFTHE